MNDFLQSLRNGQSEKPRTPKTRKNYDNSYHYSSAARFQSYGGGYQQPRNQQMKRPPLPQQQHANQMPAMDDTTVTSMLAEAIESLSRHIETLAKNQDYLITVHERTADMLERQALAIEKIVSHLNIGMDDDLQPPEAQGAQDQSFEHHYVSSMTPEPEPEPEPEPVQVKAPEKKQAAPPAAKAEKQVIRRRKIVTKPVKTQTPDTAEAKLLSRETIMDIITDMRKEGATYDQVASRLIELGQPTFSGRGEWHAQTIHRLCSKK